ncbi:MAG: putative polysaccharide deacetylase [Flavipsychrobacter sp.]|nr:putative polysaccharide deacetylase [Flavipsychrobacter sp.]
MSSGKSMEHFITSYAELKSGKKSPRKYLRDVALTGLSWAADKKYLRKPRVQFIYLHHLFKDEEAGLDALMKRLSEEHEFISYADAINKVISGTIDKPYITFSADDGFRNNLAVAEILNRYNAKACFFINPGMIGVTDLSRIKQYCKDQLHFPPVEFLNWDEVAQLQQWGHEIGSHTMMHMNIAAATLTQITDDLGETYKILNDRCGGVHHFAYPYGRFFHFSVVGREAVFNAGFTSCATAERGCHINPVAPMRSEELCIRRDNTVLGWDMAHIMYFLITNAKNATINNNFYPLGFK